MKQEYIISAYSENHIGLLNRALGQNKKAAQARAAITTTTATAKPAVKPICFFFDINPPPKITRPALKDIIS